MLCGGKSEPCGFSATVEFCRQRGSRRRRGGHLSKVKHRRELLRSNAFVVCYSPVHSGICVAGFGWRPGSFAFAGAAQRVFVRAGCLKKA
jgi:hypothetical protein